MLYAQLGMVSLCQYALFGVGGWVAFGSIMDFIFRSRSTFCASGTATSIFGVIFGLPALRMRGFYFALVTLMIAGAFQVFINATSFPDGGPGFTGNYAGAHFTCRIRLLAPTDSAYFAMWSSLLRSALW